MLVRPPPPALRRRACPVYAGEFALDSRAVRRVDNRRSVGGDERGAARTSTGGALASFRTSFGRGRDSLESAFDDEEEACASSSEDEDEIYVEETEPDDDRRRSLAHRRSVGRRPRATRYYFSSASGDGSHIAAHAATACL